MFYDSQCILTPKHISEMAKPAKKVELTNFYETIPHQNDSLYSYPNESEIQMKLPFRALVLGPSGSGKTNIVMNLIKNINVFDQIVLLAKNLDEPLYKHLITTCRAIQTSDLKSTAWPSP